MLPVRTAHCIFQLLEQKPDVRVFAKVALKGWQIDIYKPANVTDVPVLCLHALVRGFIHFLILVNV